MPSAAATPARSQTKTKTKSPQPHAPLTRFQSLDRIFPDRRIHLTSGADRSGKTLLLFTLMDWISSGLPIFGHNADHIPFCYVSVCHVIGECRMIADRADLCVPERSIQSVAGRREGRSFEEVIGLAKRKVEGCKLVLIDGLPGLATCKVGDYNENAAYLNDCQRVVEEAGVMVIGTSRFAKARGDRTSGSAIGSVAWTEYTSTQIVIDRVSREHPELRRVLVAPRGMAESTYYYRFNDHGLFTETPAPDLPGRTQFESWLFGHPEGSEISTADMMEFGETVGVTSRTIARYIQQFYKERRLLKRSFGVYAVARKQ